jgi:L-ascorbate metabolism protein UlaG (beta-lactamase superfamily)
MWEHIEFLGHATFKIRGSSLVYTDPYKIGGGQPADLILITHSHFDHCSPEDVRKIAGQNTTIVASRDCAESLRGLAGRFVGLSPCEKVEVRGVSVEAVPAYNIDKSFHPKASNWNGYVFVLDGTRYYHPGDTDKIPEMNDLRVDVAFLPVGGTYTMDFREAAAVVSILDPKAAIPMHYGEVIGSEKDAKAFVKLVGDKGIIIPAKKHT